MRPDAEEKARQLTFEDLLLDTCEPGEQGHASHLHAAYESVAFTSDEPMDPRRFLAFLDSRPEGLYRIKGFADFGEGDLANKYALHAVGRFLRFVPRPWARGERRLTQLVLIGSGIDAEALHKDLADCRVPTDSVNVPHDAGNASPGAGPHGAHHHAGLDAAHDAGQDAAHDASRTASQDHVDRERREHHERSMWGVLRYVQQPADAD